MLVFLIIFAGLLSWVTSLWLIKKTATLGLIDVPNARSSHTRPTPKGGGIGIAVGFVITLGLCFARGLFRPSSEFWVIVGGYVALAILGFFSDRAHLSARLRMLLQTAVAALTVWIIGQPTTFEIAGTYVNMGWLGMGFSVLWLVSVTNFYNFMDGIDGLAAAQGIIAGIGIAFLGWRVSQPLLVATGLIFAGATLGFLSLNISPAKLFMGDVGSYPAGFLLASGALLDKHLLVPVAMILAVFLFDTIVTLLRRMIRGERWQEAHKSHFYQRAVQLGFSHLQVTRMLSLVMLILTLLACRYVGSSPLEKIVFIFVALSGMTGLARWVSWQEHVRGGVSKK